MSKPNQLIDAVKTATDIHNGDYSSLHGKYFVIRVKIKKSHHPRGKPVKKSRLDRIEESIAKLAKQMNDRFDCIDTRINNLEKDINARLDYIVKANNLKDNK